MAAALPENGFRLELLLEKAQVQEDQQLVSGYAYVTEEHGQQVVDHSGDVISTEEIQKAAHDFIAVSRQGGVEHVRKAGEIVDSIVFTEELNRVLQKSDGLVGWFITYHVQDAGVWKMVKDRELRAFSIGGVSEVEAV